MNDDLRREWIGTAEKLAPHLRPPALRIAKHETDDFTLMWMLADFAQMLVHYTALILLAEARDNEGLLAKIRNSKVPETILGFGRPSFGHWIELVRKTLASLDPERGPEKTADFSALDAGLPEMLSRVVNRRNTLAHGPRGRVAVSSEEIDDFSRQVLDLAIALAPVVCLPLNSEDEATSPKLDGRLETAPFILSGTDREHPQCFEHLARGKHALYSDHHRLIERPDLTAPISEVLERLAPPVKGATLDVATITMSEIVTRIEESFATAKQRALEDERAAWGEPLPLDDFAGRRAFAEALASLARDRACIRLCLHAGHRDANLRFAVGFATNVRRDPAKGVLTLLSDASRDTGSALDHLFSATLGIAGDLRALHGAISRLSKGRPHVTLVLTGADIFLRSTASREQLAAFTSLLDELGGFDLILISRQPVEERDLPSFIVRPLPPLSQAASRAIYDWHGLRTGAMPLTEWNELPRDARALLVDPPSIALFAEIFQSQPVPADFDVDRYSALFWKHSVTDRAEHAKVCATLAAACLVASRESVPAGEWSRPMDESLAMQRALADLIQLGIVRSAFSAEDAAECFSFGTFEFLRFGLAGLPPFQIERMRTWDSAALADFIQTADAFPALIDATAPMLAELPARKVEELFHLALNEKLSRRGALVECLIETAYRHSDEGLLARFVALAAVTGDEVVCEATAAAAMHIATVSDSEAGDILRRLEAAYEAHGMKLLAARTTHERIARLGQKPADIDGALSLMIRTAKESGRPDLAHNFANTHALLRLGDRHDEAAAREVIRELQPLASDESAQPRWRADSLLHLSRAASDLPPADCTPFLPCAQSAAKLYLQLNDWPMAACALLRAGELHLHAGGEKSRNLFMKCFEQAARWADATSDMRLASGVRIHIASMLLPVDPVAAARVARESISLLREAGNPEFGGASPHSTLHTLLVESLRKTQV